MLARSKAKFRASLIVLLTIFSLEDLLLRLLKIVF